MVTLEAKNLFVLLPLPQLLLLSMTLYGMG